MSLKKSQGNMYEFVSHCHTHLGGRCPHECVYCYVDNPRWGRPKKYEGEIRLLAEEFKVKYGKGKTIFVEHCNDLFAEKVPSAYIKRILMHCILWPDNTYVFQTKNPDRYLDFIMPEYCILGTTAETNRDMDLSKAPPPRERLKAMAKIKRRKFITIEPICAFDLKEFVDLIVKAKPEFVNIGADSKNHNLQEPTWAEVRLLIAKLMEAGIEVRRKTNLSRLEGAK